MGRVGLGRSFIIGSRAVIPFSTTGRYNAGMEKRMDAGGKEAYRSVEAAFNCPSIGRKRRERRSREMEKGGKNRCTEFRARWSRGFRVKKTRDKLQGPTIRSRRIRKRELSLSLYNRCCYPTQGLPLYTSHRVSLILLISS